MINTTTPRTLDETVPRTREIRDDREQQSVFRAVIPFATMMVASRHRVAEATT